MHIDTAAEIQEGRSAIATSTKTVDGPFTAHDRHRLIEQAAFDRAKNRGFVAGFEVEDWLLAEKDFEAASGLVEPTPRWDLA